MTTRIDRLMRAAFQREKTARKLCTVTAETLPNGTVVSIRIGRSEIEGVVIGCSDSWWHDPGTVYIRNVRTGKTRKFNAASRYTPWTIIGDTHRGVGNGC